MSEYSLEPMTQGEEIAHLKGELDRLRAENQRLRSSIKDLLRDAQNLKHRNDAVSALEVWPDQDAYWIDQE